MRKQIATMIGGFIFILFFSLLGNNVQAAQLDCSTASNINVPVVECEALLDLYDSTDGENRGYPNTWDTDTDICTWLGITCSDIGGINHITEIFIPHYIQMSGHLAASLSVLTHITNFTIRNQGSITGELPSERSTWSNITSFEISQSSITGPLPSERSARTNLESFTMNWTEINGELPSERSARSNIETFNISNTEINGELPVERSNWVNIHTFNVSQSSITGPLPVERSNWTNIQSFNTLRASITGPLPVERSNWTNIEFFGVGDNITGELPVERSARTNLNSLQVHGNISGELPVERSNRTNMQSLRLNGGNISGELPSERSVWTGIQYIWLENMTITSTLPSERSTWGEMRSFNLSNISISGELPVERSVWGKITTFGILNTSISGELPSERSVWDTIQGMYIVDNQNLGGSLPSSRGDRSDNIRWVDIKGNGIGGFLPSERGYRNSLESIDLSNNQLYGHIPDTWMSFLNFNNGGGYKLIIDNNCLRDHEYTTEQEERIQSHTYYYPQNDCAQTDISITKTAIQDLVDTGSTINYEISYYNSGFDAFNVVIHENPGTGLSIQSASESYTTSSNEQYGVPGDMCYDQLYNNNTGYYLELLDVRATNIYGWFGDYTLQEYVEEWLGYMGSDRGAYFIDNVGLNEGFESFQAFMEGYELDMAANSDCGYVDGPLIYNYVFSLGNILANTGSLINIVGHIADDINMNQNFIQNTVTISIANPETDYGNNQDTTTNYFTFSPPVYGCTDPEANNYNAQADEDDGLCEYTSNDEGESSGGGGGGGVAITQDDCPDGDLSGSYYDDTCEQSEEENEEELQEDEVIIDHGSAPVKSTNRCDTYQEKVTPYNFIDIKNTTHESAIELLIDNCLVHGYYNQGIEYGTNDNLKMGEVYKVFTRLSGLPKQEVENPLHWSDAYFQAGDKANLWNNVYTSNTAESLITRKQLLEVTINYMKLKGYDIILPEEYAIKEGSITRGEFASFIEQIMLYNTSQENQPEGNDTDQETTTIIDEEVSPNNKNTLPRSGDSLQNITSYHQDKNLGGFFGKAYDTNPRHSLHNSIS